MAIISMKGSAKSYVDFYDHRGRRHRIVGFRGRQRTERYGANIARLVERLTEQTPTDPELAAWIRKLPHRQAVQLVRLGLIDGPKTTATPLLDLVSEYATHLEDSGTPHKDAKDGARQCRLIIEAVGAKAIADFAPSKVEGYLARRRRGKGAITAATSNRYLARIKAFINWRLRETGSPQANPLRHMRKLSEGRGTRRELTLDEQVTLLAMTAAGPTRYGLTGVERREIYQFALESGLRANEIRQLTWRDFDLQSCSVTLRPRAGGHRPKVGNLVRQPIPAGLAAQLATRSFHVKPGERMFRLPEKTAAMLEVDLIAAKITTAGVVFHSLRHTYGSNLLRGGCDLPTLQGLMRHQSIRMTIDRYGHVPTGAAQAALARAYGDNALRLTHDTPGSARGQQSG